MIFLEDCKHEFCKRCVRKLLSQKRAKCPLCRNSFKKQNLSPARSTKNIINTLMFKCFHENCQVKKDNFNENQNITKKTRLTNFIQYNHLNTGNRPFGPPFFYLYEKKKSLSSILICYKLYFIGYNSFIVFQKLSDSKMTQTRQYAWATYEQWSKWTIPLLSTFVFDPVT